ncbi:hypothetical protein GY24_00090 [Microterricola pindariensis]|uniref:HTH luxR-type domain-containing protein n=1 Tax=Microterricola pindariensis TaxID=478010 RepID=A0ABX5B086_9MICO|nr:hypothetical protein GY24_00090 [Microterricola pindariensis]
MCALVVSPRALLRLGVVSVLSAGTLVQRVSQAEDLREARRLSAGDRPTLVLIDLDGDVPADELHAILLEAGPGLAVLGFNAVGRSDAARMVMRLRRGAVLDHDADPAALLGAVSMLLAPSVAEIRPVRPLLTSRQSETLSLAARGMSNAQIAATLHISVGTVKRHLSDAFLALGARSRIEAINRARSLGQLRAATA